MDSMLFGNVFRLVGSLEKTGTGYDTAVFIGMENMPAIVASGKVKNLQPDDISVILVKVKPGVDPATVAASVEDNIIEADAMARKDIGKNIITTLTDMSRIFTMTIVLDGDHVLLPGLGHLYSHRERAVQGSGHHAGHRREGVRTSSRIFLIEVLVIGLAGSLLGIVAGTGLSAVLSKGFYDRETALDRTVRQRTGGDRRGELSGRDGRSACFGALGPIQRLKKMEPLMVIKTE